MSQAPRNNIRLSLRTTALNTDHHLWNNNGTYWCHFTLHGPRGTKQRIRRSLRTADLASARQRRDALLSRLNALSIPPSVGLAT
jgi:hypothetical protein